MESERVNSAQPIARDRFPWNAAGEGGELLCPNDWVSQRGGGDLAFQSCSIQLLFKLYHEYSTRRLPFQEQHNFTMVFGTW